MYAVIKTGGKQYRVAEGDTIEIEHLTVKGESTTFTPVLVVTDEGETIYGAKALKDYTVSAKVLGDAKGDKVTVFKYRPKSGYASKGGHRQLYSLIEITSIGAKGRQKSAAAKAESKTDSATSEGGSKKAEPKTDMAKPDDESGKESLVP